MGQRDGPGGARRKEEKLPAGKARACIGRADRGGSLCRRIASYLSSFLSISLLRDVLRYLRHHASTARYCTLYCTLLRREGYNVLNTIQYNILQDNYIPTALHVLPLRAQTAATNSRLQKLRAAQHIPPYQHARLHATVPSTIHYITLHSASPW